MFAYRSCVEDCWAVWLSAWWNRTAIPSERNCLVCLDESQTSRDNQDSVADAARTLYAEQLRELLEPEHNDEFVAIEPISGEYFLGQTLSQAIGAARSKYSDRLAHAMRVGHKATVHFGMQI